MSLDRDVTIDRNAHVWGYNQQVYKYLHTMCEERLVVYRAKAKRWKYIRFVFLSFYILAIIGAVIVSELVQTQLFTSLLITVPPLIRFGIDAMQFTSHLKQYRELISAYRRLQLKLESTSTPKDTIKDIECTLIDLDTPGEWSHTLSGIPVWIDRDKMATQPSSIAMESINRMDN